jgi:hypothetical protein
MTSQPELFAVRANSPASGSSEQHAMRLRKAKHARLALFAGQDNMRA